MSIKKIVKYGDETLRRKSKEVSKVSKKIQTLVHDLLDTMYAQNGVGLAAPQIGENLRVFVIDVSTGNEPLNPTVKALNIHGKPFIVEGKEGSLLARAIQHEFDHLDGILFIDHCRNRFEADRILTEKGLSPVEADKILNEPELDKALESVPANPGETVVPEGCEGD